MLKEHYTLWENLEETNRLFRKYERVLGEQAKLQESRLKDDCTNCLSLNLFKFLTESSVMVENVHEMFSFWVHALLGQV